MTENNPSRFFNIETKWLVLVAIGIGTFMSALDGSVVNTILPVVTDYFKTDVATIEWVVTTYLLVVSGLLLSVGRFGDLRGNKVAYIWGFVVFVAGSALCGSAPSPVFLIASRGLQAIGASMLFANSPAILTKNFPASQRGQALGLQGAMTYLGLSTGPFLGGWLSDTLGWHSVFYINIPIGLIAITLSLIVIPKDTPAGQTEKFDLAGASTFLVGLIALLFALNQGHNLGWTSPIILGLFSASLLILGLFTWIERRIPAPMLDLSLFKRRVFSMSTISPILNYICVYSVLFLTPFYLIQGRGLSASQAGLILTAQPIIMALTAPVSGRLSDRIGSRIPTTLGMIILGAGLFLLSRLTLESPFWLIVLGLAIGGFGTGLFVAPNNSALMGDAPRNRQGIAAGVLALSRNVGMVLGIGLTGAIFTTFLSKGNPNDAATLVHAFDNGLLFASGVAMLAAITSFARGDDRPKK
ncbi:MAG: DHA2 family efflux MFS transporter permease subunit [Anaerolineales bacterium]|jgi:EmrB/QacA subfamily drug resistance transporter